MGQLTEQVRAARDRVLGRLDAAGVVVPGFITDGELAVLAVDALHEEFERFLAQVNEVAIEALEQTGGDVVR